jgi:hypothetical protein
MIEVRIIPVIVSKRNRRQESERELAQLVNVGWEIIAAGAGYVILQRTLPGS